VPPPPASSWDKSIHVHAPEGNSVRLSTYAPATLPELAPPEVRVEMHGNQMHTDALHNQPDEHVEGEQTYLRVAEIVLTDALQPLKAREIVDRGIERGLFGDHVLSRTPEKSMQARLSTDILSRTGQSKFIRTERGRFTLRSKVPSVEQMGDAAQGYNSFVHSEYVAERRVLRTPREEVLCASEHAFKDVLTFQGIDPDTTPILRHLLDERSISYVSRSEAEVRNDAKQFVTYVLVQCGQRLLFFRRSYLSRAAEFLRGSKCIGFGGHVSAAGADILSMGDRGLEACARRELIEELHFPIIGSDEPQEHTTHSSSNTTALPRVPNRATIRLFQTAPLERLGILNDDSSEVGRRHVAVVYRTWLQDWNATRLLQKGDSSIKGLGWIDLSKDKVDIAEFEYWSQLCLRKFYPSTVIAKSGVRILNRPKLATDRIIVVAGRIGSGKTETASYLSEKLGYPLIRSGALLQEVMGAPPMREIGRREFQAIALDFIRAEGGPERLAAAIEARVTKIGAQRCIIDGLRHLPTYENLSTRFGGRTNLIFVQTPPDVAYDMYRNREAQGTLTFSHRDFLQIYDAPVEAEIPSLGRKAHVYIYNAFGLEAFRRTLDEVKSAFVERSGAAARSQPTSRGRGRARSPGGKP
jgi:predicted NUDIX family phosphoesterase